jgi:tetratricopeptide (TPR) repeat protein
VKGDNYIFPVTYGRLVERMREDVRLYDRDNILFRMPQAARGSEARSALREEKRNELEKKIIAENTDKTIYYAVFGPYAIQLPAYHEMTPEGVVDRVFRMGDEIRADHVNAVWKYYATEGFYQSFGRDFMNREIRAYFFFSLGKSLVRSGRKSAGLQNLRLAREIGYNDNLIHSDMAIFLTDHGFFEEARLSLEKALLYHEDLSGVYNSWAYYYNKKGEHEKAVDALRKAVQIKPDRFFYFSNLGFALYETGQRQESLAAFEKSLSLYENQPGIREFVEENLRNQRNQ